MVQIPALFSVMANSLQTFLKRQGRESFLIEICTDSSDPERYTTAHLLPTNFIRNGMIISGYQSLVVNKREGD